MNQSLGLVLGIGLPCSLLQSQASQALSLSPSSKNSPSFLFNLNLQRKTPVWQTFPRSRPLPRFPGSVIFNACLFVRGHITGGFSSAQRPATKNGSTRIDLYFADQTRCAKIVCESFFLLAESTTCSNSTCCIPVRERHVCLLLLGSS